MTAFPPTGTLADIVPSARPMFEDLLDVATELGMQPRVRSAGRTCADQNRLAAGGPSVTQVAGCRSWHVLGRAIDIDIIPPTCEAYTMLGELWEGWGGVWGGRFGGFGGCGDAGHFQWSEGSAAVPAELCPDENCDEARERYLESQVRRFPWGVLFGGAGVVLLGLAWLRR